jgi:hypothetical protein
VSSANKDLSCARPADEVFELRIPDNFFRQPTRFAGTDQPELAPGALDGPRATAAAASGENEPVRGFISAPEPTGAAKVHSKVLGQTATTIHSEGRGEPHSTIQLVQPPDISESQVAAPGPGSVVSKIVDQGQNERAAGLCPVPTVPASDPLPRQESKAEQLRQRQPPITQSAPNPSRLRIDRVDINIINSVETPQLVQTREADISQVLEREHFGRVERLL